MKLTRALQVLALATVCAGVVGAVAFAGNDNNKASTQAAAMTKAATKQLSESDDGKTITVKQGTVIEVTLKGNVTTGFGWDVTSVSGSAVTQSGKVKYVSDPNPGPRPVLGRGGVFKAKFSASAAGTSTVKMAYRRPWEKNTAPAQTFEVTIKVVP